MGSHRGLFAQIEPGFWLNDPRIRSLSARDRGYYVDIWVMTVVQGHEVLRGWCEACKHAWRSNDARTRDIVRRIAQPMPGRKPLVTIISDDLLRVTGSAKVHKRRTKGPQVVQADVDVDREVDVDVHPSALCARPDVDVDVEADTQVDAKPKAPKTPQVTGPKPPTATAGSQMPARESNGNGKAHANIVETWTAEGFQMREALDAIVTRMLRHYDSAQILLAHTYDVDQDETIDLKHAALLHRLTKGKHPPSDASMAAAKKILNRGDVSLDEITKG
ncbi:MAG: hypothetical protein ACYTBJ_01810 [Planctomycetota bacterium]|jgi:hypothetical protein